MVTATVAYWYSNTVSFRHYLLYKGTTIQPYKKLRMNLLGSACVKRVSAP